MHYAFLPFSSAVALEHYSFNKQLYKQFNCFNLCIQMLKYFILTHIYQMGRLS